MSILARASLGRRTFGRLALAGLGAALAATLAGCGGEAACDNEIVKERNLDQKDEKQLEVAARAAVQEMEDAWKAGRFTLENAATVEFDPKTNKASCRARMVFMTAWGISVRDVNYEASIANGQLQVTATVPN